MDDPERLTCNKSKEKREMLSSHQKWHLQNLVLLGQSRRDAGTGLAGPSLLSHRA